MTDISNARLTSLIGMGMALPESTLAAWSPRIGGRAFGKTAALDAFEAEAVEAGRTVQRMDGGTMQRAALIPSDLAPPAGGGRRCRVCSCTETDACIDEETGEPCGWAEDMGDLCTACVVPLEKCTGETPECPHLYCPDGYHTGDDLPCSCTPDCAADEDD